MKNYKYTSISRYVLKLLLGLDTKSIFRNLISLYCIIFYMLFSIHAFGQKHIKRVVYRNIIDSTTYNQYQIDSIREELSSDSGKMLVIMNKIEKEDYIEVLFNYITVKSIDTVSRKWLNKDMPTFILKDLDGNVITNKFPKNKIMVINLWSTTCLPCMEEMPDLNRLVAKYSDKNVIFVAPSPESEKTILNVLYKNHFMYKVTPNSKSLFDAMDVPGYPYHIVVDEQGVIRYIQSGTRSLKTGKKIAETELIEAIERVLEK